MKRMKANAQKKVEQDVDLVLKNLKLNITVQPHDKVLITTDPRYKHYKASVTAFFLKMAYCSEKVTEKLVASSTTKISSPSNWSAKNSEVCTRNLESTPKFPEQKLPTGKKINSLNFAHSIKEWVMSCDKCKKNHGLNAALPAKS